MKSEFSLTSILKNDSVFEHLQETKKFVKKTKDDLLENAKNFTSKYTNEINEGTKKRRLLLEDAKSKGLKEDEYFKNHTEFIPTESTPLLNYLHYLTKEYGNGDNINLYESNEIDLLLNNILLESEQRGDIIHDSIESDKKTPSMESYIYKNMDSKTFGVIKKLKALSRSVNKQEAFLAYSKCLELCKKYNLEFDKIPSF